MLNMKIKGIISGMIVGVIITILLYIMDLSKPLLFISAFSIWLTTIFTPNIIACTISVIFYFSIIGYLIGSILDSNFKKKILVIIGIIFLLSIIHYITFLHLEKELGEVIEEFLKGLYQRSRISIK